MPHDPTYDVSAPPTPQRRSARPSFTSHLSPLESLAGALTAIDFLVYAPIDLQRQFAATKGPCGGAATLLIPVVILSIFGVIFTTNAAISDVSESSIVDLTQRAPMMLQVTCTSKSSQGSINPLCSGMQPEHHYTPAAFQFVPSISDSRCQRSIPRAMNRTTTQPWIDPHSQEHSTFSSPAIKQLEVDLGVPASDIAGKSDPFQLITFANLAQDLAIKPQNIWAKAGQSFATKGGVNLRTSALDIATLQNVSLLSTSRSTREQYPYLRRTDIIEEIELENVGISGYDPFHDAVDQATMLPGRKSSLGFPIPLCPFPDMEHSSSLSVTPPAAGLGFMIVEMKLLRRRQASCNSRCCLVMDPAPFFLPRVCRLRFAKAPAHSVGTPLAMPHSSQWYARIMSWSDSPELTLPFMSYSIDVTRNIYTDGTVSIDATATATLGLFSHGDAGNYYGWGNFQEEAAPHLAACGDLYSVGAAEMLDLFSIAQELGFGGTWGDFVADGSWALADLLPSTAVNFSLGCGTNESSVVGWPRPACEAAQALRASLKDNETPLVFNVNSTGDAAGLSARLRDIYARIQQQSDAFIHESLLPKSISEYDPGNTLLLDTKNGWQAARAHANSMSAMMQAQHGCGLYCTEPIAYGVGVSTIVWITPVSSRRRPVSEIATLSGNGTALVYVQRARPAVICDDVSFPLPWARNDPTEYFSGDLSRIRLSSGPTGWRTSRLPSPVAAIVFRSSTWTDIRWSNSRQSSLALLGSALGYAGLLFTSFRLIKRYLHHHATQHVRAAATVVSRVPVRAISRRHSPSSRTKTGQNIDIHRPVGRQASVSAGSSEQLPAHSCPRATSPSVIDPIAHAPLSLQPLQRSARRLSVHSSNAQLRSEALRVPNLQDLPGNEDDVAMFPNSNPIASALRVSAGRPSIVAGFLGGSVYTRSAARGGRGRGGGARV